MHQMATFNASIEQVISKYNFLTRVYCTNDRRRSLTEPTNG